MRSYKKYILHIAIASIRFMASLSNIVNNISEGIHKIKGKYGHNNKKCETCRIQCKYCDWFLEFCNKKYQQKFDEKLKECFFNTLNFLTTTVISLFYCCQKVFIIMNIWMIGKNLMKHYLKEKIFIT